MEVHPLVPKEERGDLIALAIAESVYRTILDRQTGAKMRLPRYNLLQEALARNDKISATYKGYFPDQYFDVAVKITNDIDKILRRIDKVAAKMDKEEKSGKSSSKKASSKEETQGQPRRRNHVGITPDMALLAPTKRGAEAFQGLL